MWEDAVRALVLVGLALILSLVTHTEREPYYVSSSSFLNSSMVHRAIIPSGLTPLKLEGEEEESDCTFFGTVTEEETSFSFGE